MAGPISSRASPDATPTPRFRLRAEAIDWRPASPATSEATGARTAVRAEPLVPILQKWGRGRGKQAAPIWIPAARLVSLRARAGDTERFLLVLERRTGDWTQPEGQLVGATIGGLRGADTTLDAAVSFGSPELAGAELLLPLTITLPADAVPGRYKGPIEVRCGRRIEPLALLIEVVGA